MCRRMPWSAASPPKCCRSRDRKATSIALRHSGSRLAVRGSADARLGMAPKPQSFAKPDRVRQWGFSRRAYAEGIDVFAGAKALKRFWVFFGDIPETSLTKCNIHVLVQCGML